MSKYEIYSLIIQLVAAVGTVAVAIMAIWGDFVRSIFSSPNLKIKLKTAAGEKTHFSTGTKARYYHLAVSNSRRWSTAKNVVVYLRMVQKQGPDQEWQSEMYTGPVPLVWQFGKFEAGLPLVGPEKYCDLCSISEEGQLKLITKFVPNNLDPIIKPNVRTRIHLSAFGDNAESNILTLEISWNGKWEDGDKEMEKNLIIKEIKNSISKRSS